MAAKKSYYWATRPFDYAGTSLSRGQIVELSAQPNDEKLLRLGYLKPYEGAEKDLVECPDCGALFYEHDPKIAHGKLVHGFLDEVERDRLEDREEKIADRISPLKLDQTIAAKAAA